MLDWLSKLVDLLPGAGSGGFVGGVLGGLLFWGLFPNGHSCYTPFNIVVPGLERLNVVANEPDLICTEGW
jgi:hypothetical protein